MKPPFHRPTFMGVVKALHDTFNSGYYADKVIEHLFKNNRKWGSRDRRFVAQTVYDIVRWWRPLLFAATGKDLYANTPPFSEEMLEHVVISYLIINDVPLPDWLEATSEEVETVKDRWQQRVDNPAMEYSLAEWWQNLGKQQLGERWDQLMPALNRQAPIFLRANSLKTNVIDLKKELAKENIGVQPVEGVEDALVLGERSNVFVTQAFKAGLFEVQDAGSQLIAPFLQVKPGERVVDACAGAGGKTLHLAALMGNKGKVIALDIHERKLQELRRRVRRAGVDIVEAKEISSSKVTKRLHDSADKLLLDVPCTGSGVLRRNPDSKWKLTEQRLEELLGIQREILSSYSRMVKVGGKLVYATCSVLPMENQDQVKSFLSQNETSWSLDEELIVHPETTTFDGFYAARLSRNS